MVAAAAATTPAAAATTTAATCCRCVLLVGFVGSGAKSWQSVAIVRRKWRKCHCGKSQCAKNNCPVDVIVAQTVAAVAVAGWCCCCRLLRLLHVAAVKMFGARFVINQCAVAALLLPLLLLLLLLEKRLENCFGQHVSRRNKSLTSFHLNKQHMWLNGRERVEGGMSERVLGRRRRENIWEKESWINSCAHWHSFCELEQVISWLIITVNGKK